MYLAGVVISTTIEANYVENKVQILGYMLLSPIFFTSIGLNASFKYFNHETLEFTIMLLIIALASKIVGCGLGAKFSKFTNRESLRIGIGMMSRGEVALIVDNRGVSSGIMEEAFLTPIIFVVIIATLITPILLEISYKSNIKQINENI